MQLLYGADLLHWVEDWWFKDQFTFVETLGIAAWFLGSKDLNLLGVGISCRLTEDLIGSLQLEFVGLHLLGYFRVVELHQDFNWLSDLKRILEHRDFGSRLFLNKITDLIGNGLDDRVLQLREHFAVFVKLP